MAISLPSIEFRGRKLDSPISFLILLCGLFLSIAMPLLMHRDPGPDAMTLWTSYVRSDNCNFWNPFSPDRSSYECSAYLLRPTGINLTNAWAYGMLCNLFLTSIPIFIFKRIPITIFLTLCLWGVVRSFFLDNLTKEIIVSVAVIAILFFLLFETLPRGLFPLCAVLRCADPALLDIVFAGLGRCVRDEEACIAFQLFRDVVHVLPGDRDGHSVAGRLFGFIHSRQ
ncbi:hypothetical protein OKW12_001182 [Pseudomonas silensiensis]|nr:hypothetical protein [Pseudomonas silensiensis]